MTVRSLSRYLSRHVRYHMSHRALQRLYERVHLWSLYGMNIGGATRSFRASGEMALLRQIAKEWPARDEFVCIDVGANIGDYTALVLSLFDNCRVIAVEPAARTYGILSERFASDKRVQCLCYAIGRDASVATLWRPVDRHQCASLLPLAGSGEGSAPIPELVTVTTLDDLCETLDLPQLNLLKVDVEGTELDVLAGARQLFRNGRLERVQFEYGEASFMSGARLVDFFNLFSDDFSLYRLTRTGPYLLGKYRSSLEIAVSATNYLAIRQSHA